MLCLAAYGCGQTSRHPEATMADAWEVFSEPEDENRTKVWWFHGETETTREGITADLEAFKRAGVGGVVYYDQVHGDGEGALPAFSGQWWEMLKFAASEARRVGLGFDINISNGYVAGGPWISDSLGMQRLLATDTVVMGGRKLRLELPEPDERVFRDVAVIAFPARAGHIGKYCNWTREGDRLVMESDSAVTVRSISYRTVLKGKSRGGAMNEPGPPADKFYSPSFKERPPVGTLEASEDGVHYTKVCDLPPLYAQCSANWDWKTVAFPAVSARFFRLTATEDLKDGAYLSAAARMNNWEEKAALYAEYIDDNDTPDYSGDEVIRSGELVDLCARSSDGVVEWDAPEGEWCVMRFYMTPTGVKSRHGRKNLVGLETDKLSRTATLVHWNNYVQPILDTLASIGIKPDGICMDSHEAGSQNWTPGFEKEFASRRGYSIMEYLPVMAGLVVDSSEKTEKILYDLRNTISECVADNYFGELQRLADDSGLEFTAQAMGNGQSMVVDNLAVKGRVERPQGEFWARHRNGSYDIKEASSAAHIYGKTIASAEAFTDMKYHQTFADMKVLADFAYANNVNEFVVCASAYQPWTDRIPGNTAGGWHFCLNRNNTYWEYSRSFWDYQARCAGVLRLGTAANDLCIYLGNNSPVKLQTYRLPEIPAGYGFDVCTADGLLGQTYGKDGKLKLKAGGEYGILVIEDKSDVPEEVERYISKLRAEGVPVCRGSGLADALREFGIKPDLVDSSRHTTDSKLHFGHRILADADLYFICNHSKDSYCGGISVRSSYSNVYWWNPLDGSRVRLDSSPDGEYRSVSMELAPEESGFLVVSDVQIDGLETRVPDAAEKTVEIAGPWEIFFDPASGGCGTVSADELFDWSESEDPRIRYYSGTAVYSCTFDMDSVGPDPEVFLKFQRLGAIARVYVNGSVAGDVWCSPWKVEIGNLLREGRNELRIEVTNTLADRIIGDALKPASERSTYSTTEIYGKGDKPYASGIMGQLCLEVREKD